MDSFLRPCIPSITLWRALACLCNTKQDDSPPPPRRSKAKEKGKEPDTREERKKETNKQTDRQTREKERKKKREQSDCERAAPHPGSRVSNRYHHSVGKNQSPGVGPGRLTWKRVDLERPNQPGSRVFDCEGKVLACTNIVGAA